MSDVKKIKFRSTMVPPPGGKFFFDYNGEHIEARNWLEMEPRMKEFMRTHNMTGNPALIVAAYMCPHMPDWYCDGVSSDVTNVRISEAKENARQYFPKQTVTFDEISRRMQICTRCPRHRRTFCLTCTGILDWLQAQFGGRRVRVPEDKASGVCMCARTMESVIASVDFGPDDRMWDLVPDNCWRKQT